MSHQPESKRVPRVQFDTRHLAPASRQPAFALITQSLYESSAYGDPAEFACHATGYRVGDLVFSVVTFSPTHFVRDERHLQAPNSDFFVLEMQVTGEQTLLMGGLHRHLLPWHINLRDWSCGFEAEATAMNLQSILIPRRRLQFGSVLGADNPMISWSMDAPDGRMLSLLWRELQAVLEEVSLAEAEGLAQAFLGFLDGLLGRQTTQDATATFGAMQQYLKVRLHSKAGVADLCRHFHVSRSTVYRIFAPVGGVVRFVNEARLERCRIELRYSDPDRTSVGKVATSWGFPDPSSFSRRFRNYFGIPPSTVLGSARVALEKTAQRDPDEKPSEESADHRYHEYMAWFKQATGWEPTATTN